LEQNIPGYRSQTDWDLVTFQNSSGQLVGAAAVRRLRPSYSVMIDFAMNSVGAGFGGMCFAALMRCLHDQGVLHVTIDVPVGGATSAYLARLGPSIQQKRTRSDHFEFFTGKWGR